MGWICFLVCSTNLNTVRAFGAAALVGVRVAALLLFIAFRLRQFTTLFFGFVAGIIVLVAVQVFIVSFGHDGRAVLG